MTELAIAHVYIGLLDPNPWNPNVQDEATKQATRESIEAYGFIDPVTVWAPPGSDRLQIIDGEHRWTEATALGHTVAPVVVLDVDETAARKLTVILNETRGDHDVVKLGELLAQLRTTLSEDELLLGMPFSSNELAQMIAVGNRDDWDDLSDAGPDDKVKPSVFVVEFRNARELQRFGKLVETLAREQEITESEAVVRAVQVAARDR